MSRRKDKQALFLHRIQWRNPYTDPPDGRPRVLAEVATYERKQPPELAALYTPGSGYGVTFQHVPPPKNVLTPEKLAERRQKAIRKKMNERYPLFGETFAAERIAADPAYYQEGNSKADQGKLEHVAEEAERYHFLSANVDKLFNYDD